MKAFLLSPYFSKIYFFQLLPRNKLLVILLWYFLLAWKHLVPVTWCILFCPLKAIFFLDSVASLIQNNTVTLYFTKNVPTEISTETSPYWANDSEVNTTRPRIEIFLKRPNVRWLVSCLINGCLLCFWRTVIGPWT